MSDKLPGSEELASLTQSAVNATVSVPLQLLEGGGKGDVKSVLKGAQKQLKNEAKKQGVNLATNLAVDALNSQVPMLGSILKDDIGSSIAGKVLGGKKQKPPPPVNWYSLARARLDPLLSFNWDIDLPEINGIRLSREYVEDIQPTFLSYEEIPIFLNGKRDYFCGTSDIGGLTITCYEDAVAGCLAYWKLWQSFLRNPGSGVYSPPSLYMKNILVHITAYMTNKKKDKKTKDNQPEIVATLEFVNCFPKDLQGFDLTSTGSDRIRPTVSLACSDVKYTSNTKVVDKLMKVLYAGGSSPTYMEQLNSIQSNLVLLSMGAEVLGFGGLSKLSMGGSDLITSGVNKLSSIGNKAKSSVPGSIKG